MSVARERWRLAARVVGGLIVLLVIGALGVALLLPGYVRRRAIEDARREGIELAVGQVSLSWSSVRLYALEARANELPGSVLRMEEADVDLEGLSPTALHLVHPDALVGASQLELSQEVLAFRKVHPTTNLEGIRKVDFEHGSLRWPQGIAGADLEATEASGSVAGTPDLGDERHLVVDRLTLQRTSKTTGNTAYGPWRLRVDATRAETDVKVALDPAHEADASLAVTVKKDATRVDVHVKRARFATLGVPASDVLMPPGLNPDVELEAHLVEQDAAPRQEGTLHVAAWAVPLPRVGGTGDASLDVAWAGDGKSPAPITKGTFALGPFEGTVSGTVQPAPALLGAKADVTFKSKPIPCSRLASTAATEALGALGQKLGELAERTGLTKAVTGTTEITGELTLDTADVEATRYAVKANVGCGVFPFKP